MTWRMIGTKVAIGSWRTPVGNWHTGAAPAWRAAAAPSTSPRPLLLTDPVRGLCKLTG